MQTHFIPNRTLYTGVLIIFVFGLVAAVALIFAALLA